MSKSHGSSYPFLLTKCCSHAEVVPFCPNAYTISRYFFRHVVMSVTHENSRESVEMPEMDGRLAFLMILIDWVEIRDNLIDT